MGYGLCVRLLSNGYHARASITLKELMEKIKNFLLSTNFAVVVLFMIGMRIVVCGASVGDALALASVCSLQGFYRWVEMKTPVPLSDVVAKELKEIKAHVTGLVLKNSMRAPESTEIRKFF